MRKRIRSESQYTAAHRALADHKLATLNVIISSVPERITFAELGKLMGYSHEWVRQRLIKNVHLLFKIGKRYQVPKGVAVDFVRSVYGQSAVPQPLPTFPHSHHGSPSQQLDA